KLIEESTMGASLLDRLYASQSNKRLFFRDGWGDLPLLERLAREGPVQTPAPAIRIDWEPPRDAPGAVLQAGSFASPFTGAGFPEASRTAYVERILPRGADARTSVCVHFAATGDEGFERRRRTLALPLAREGIGSLLLENPFYGRRRPPDQHSKMLNRFSDLWAMGGATVLEGRALVRWLGEAGCERIGVSGVSMGGGMAAQVGVLAERPVAIASFITPNSASAVFTEGVLKHYLAWDVLNRQLDGKGAAVEFMRTLLDLSDLRRLPPPARPDAAYLVAAKRDAYIPPAAAERLHAHWPGSHLQWLNTGHIGAFLFHRRTFLAAIRSAFDQL
ncbi:MAG TPA: alpha/beta hydrolase family protein, partial [Syntrophales bacterium]|nr:alpha/beta hydrolase family protein [Syntrophales bacterium]